MSRRAASMAAMAKRATNPEEIQAIQRSLVTGVQNGSIQPYIGIPLIQDLTKKLTEAKASMAQNVAGAGMPQPPAGGPPIAQQVMQQAEQEDRGVETLPSNLPQSYAGGGIIAFEGGGEVERYQNKGLVSDDEQTKRNKEREAQARRDRAALLTLPAAAGDILAGPYNYLAQTGEAAANAIGVPRIGRALGIYDSDVNSVGIPRIGAGGNTPYSDMLNRYAAGDSTAPPPAPASAPYNPADATRRSAYTDAPIPNTPGAAPAAPSAAPGAAIPGASSFKMPTFAGMTMPPAPASTNYQTSLGDMEAKTKKERQDAESTTQKTLEGFDEPGNTAREEKYSKREAAQAKNSAMDRALNIMNLGFGIAGSKERTLAGALGNEGREGIRDLLKGEAANRAALDRLDDLRDNFEQQKTAAKKGNYQAAQAAGERAVDNVYKYQDLNMKAAHYGNTEALQRYHTEMQGNFQQASLDQSGKLGIADLGLKQQQLAQTGAFQNKQLEMMGKRYDAMDKQAQARIQQVHAGAMAKFMENTAPQLNAQFTKDYGPNWRTAKDPRSLEAQMKFKQAQNAYIIDALGQHDASMIARDSSEF